MKFADVAENVGRLVAVPPVLWKNKIYFKSLGLTTEYTEHTEDSATGIGGHKKAQKFTKTNY